MRDREPIHDNNHSRFLRTENLVPIRTYHMKKLYIPVFLVVMLTSNQYIYTYQGIQLYGNHYTVYTKYISYQVYIFQYFRQAHLVLITMFPRKR